VGLARPEQSHSSKGAALRGVGLARLEQNHSSKGAALRGVGLARLGVHLRVCAYQELSLGLVLHSFSTN